LHRRRPRGSLCARKLHTSLCPHSVVGPVGSSMHSRKCLRLIHSNAMSACAHIGLLRAITAACILLNTIHSMEVCIICVWNAAISLTKGSVSQASNSNLDPLSPDIAGSESMGCCKQAAKMLQIGAKVLDAVRMGPKPVPKAKAAAPAPRPPRDGTQPLKQPMQELKLVPEQRYPSILYMNGSINTTYPLLQSS